MSASSSNSASNSFLLLDTRIQKWIWESGWTELKDAQEMAIPVVLAQKTDVIIAAATASGKTEAAFFPILTHILQSQEPQSVLYISPLKALINDQWSRLDKLCDLLDVAVTPWHGDISSSRKSRFIKNPKGCLLITPESLEALLMTNGHALNGIFSGLAYIVVDELHAFIGTERGKQLQSLLHRIDTSLNRRIPRIALSATLGDMKMAAAYLRPGNTENVDIIVSKDGGQELKVLIKGYVDDSGPEQLDSMADSNAIDSTAMTAIGNHLFETLRGSNNLVFPNSRSKVEQITDMLSRQCSKLGLPNEFWPHHGSLSKEIREESEAVLKSGERPSTAICTTTLELGIDIGSVKSVAQIGPAPSVASLRQRLGRSGRRKGEPAILRCYALETKINNDSSISDRLREGLIQTIAQVNLLVRGWYEPPNTSGFHLSTFIQQLLSAIAQYGGLKAISAWQLLCGSGPFPSLNKADFVILLRHLAEKEILIQESSGLLLHGPLGEKLVNHHTFFAAFTSQEEFRVVCAGNILGTLPLSQPVQPGAYIIFAGKRWQVENLDVEKKVILVIPSKGGKVPKFEGSGGLVGDEVRMEMFKILSDNKIINFLDVNAMQLLSEARAAFVELKLNSENIQLTGKSIRLFLWKGDRILNTVTLLLRHHGLDVQNNGLYLTLNHTGLETLVHKLEIIVSSSAIPPEVLICNVLNKQESKWDWLLPEDLLNKDFASKNLNIPEAIRVLSILLERIK